MKIAFFAIDKLTPSSRYRVLKIIPHLERRGIKSEVFITKISKWGIEIPLIPKILAYLLNKYFIKSILYPVLRMYQIISEDLKKFDYIIIQKPLCDFPRSSFLEKMIYYKNKKIIFDFDDAISFNTTGIIDKKKEKQLENIIKLSQHIIVSNKYLNKLIKNSNNNVSHLLTTIDENEYKPKYVNKKEIIIGWIGTSSNIKYLIKIKKQLLMVINQYENVRMRIVTDSFNIKQFDGNSKVEYLKWNAEEEIEILQSFDIGLMPLDDNEWTRLKSGFKLFQYMAVGIPAIASNVGINNEIILDSLTGFLVKNDDEWVSSLKNLIEHDELRKRMGQNARSVFVTKYSINKYVGDLINCLLKY